MKEKIMNRITSLSMTLTLISLATSASAYYIPEKSGRTVGLAGAGATTSDKDSSVLFYNPAGMSLFKKPTASLSTVLYMPKITYTDAGSVPLPNTPASSGNGGNAGVVVPVPSIFAIYPLNDKMNLGVGLTAPFGLSIEYDKGWVGRYRGIKSSLKTIDLNPSISYKVAQNLTLGMGLSGQYIDLTREKTVLREISPQQKVDITSRLKGSTFGWGYNLGALYEFDKNTRVGIGFRSHVRNKVRDGDVTFINSSGTQIAALKGSGTVPIPESINLGVSHTLSAAPQWTLMGDLLWMGWSRVKNITVNLSDGRSDVTPHYFKNTLRTAFGAAYQVDKNFEVRGGVAYGQAPTINEFREPMIPESNIWTVSTGFGYKFSNDMTMDLNYAFKFPHASKVNLPAEPLRGLGSFVGGYQNKIHVVGLQLSWKM